MRTWTCLNDSQNDSKTWKFSKLTCACARALLCRKYSVRLCDNCLMVCIIVHALSIIHFAMILFEWEKSWWLCHANELKNKKSNSFESNENNNIMAHGLAKNSMQSIHRPSAVSSEIIVGSARRCIKFAFNLRTRLEDGTRFVSDCLMAACETAKTW